MKKDNLRRNIGLLMEYFDIASESKLARETGIGQATINKLISGSTADPRLSTMLPIAERFKITLDTLVSDSPNFSSNNETKHINGGSFFIPLITFNELNDIFSSLSLLNFENWPYWLPISSDLNSQLQYFAVKLNKNYLPAPFNKASTLICEKSLELINGIFCLIKHNDSNIISIMKILKEAGKIWLLSLKKELPATEFNADNWTYLGAIKTITLDLSNGDFFDF